MRRRFEPIAWLSLGALVVTGLIQMEASPQYQGFLAIGNRWAQAILLKHISIALMVAAAAYQTWFLQPKLERTLLLRAKRPDAVWPREGTVQSQSRLTRVNMALSLVVLALTAIARTA
jgi:putative copper export protein